MKRVFNLTKRILRRYVELSEEFYGPLFKAGINPWM